MSDKKKSPRMDGEVKDLPLKKVTKDDATQVKGGYSPTYQKSSSGTRETGS